MEIMKHYNFQDVYWLQAISINLQSNGDYFSAGKTILEASLIKGYGTGKSLCTKYPH